MVYHGLPWFTIPQSRIFWNGNVSGISSDLKDQWRVNLQIRRVPGRPRPRSPKFHGAPVAARNPELLLVNIPLSSGFFSAPLKGADFFGTIHSIRWDLVRCITENIWYLEIPSGSLTWRNGKSACLIAKYSINGPLSIAILNGVCMTIYSNLSFAYVFTE